MAANKDDGKKGGGNPLARKLLAGIADKAPKPAEAASSKPAAPGKASEGTKAAPAAKAQGGPLGELVSVLKQVAPGFGKEEARPPTKPDGWKHLEAARGGRGIGPGALAAQSKAVQAALGACGIQVAESGVYDEATEAAVRAFQSRERLDSRHGRVDALTYAALEKALGLAPGAQGNVVAAAPAEADEAGADAGESGGMVPGMAPRGGRLGMGLDLTLPAGGGKKGRSDPRAVTVEPSEEDLEEERAQQAAVAKTAPDGRPAGLPRADNAFIDRLAWPAVRAMWETGVPASVLIAMAVLESGWGERALAKEARNLFGLTGEGPAGSLTLTVGEAGYARSSEEAGLVAGGGRGKGKRLSWRRYASDTDSVLDMARTMATEPRYAEAMKNKGAPERLLRALDDTGEHERVEHFGETCARVWKQHRLEAYDRARPG